MSKNYRYPCQIVVCALIRQEEKILLVEQQWPNNPKPLWTLPGGRMEAYETVPEALQREVKEETGLTVLDHGRVLYSLQYYNPYEEERSRSATYAFEIAKWSGEIQVADPDNLIIQAVFMPLLQAIELLSDPLLLPIIGEPVVAYLKNEVVASTFWQYRRQPDGQDKVTMQVGG